MNVRRWLPAAAVMLAAAAFAWLNRGERVAVDLGLLRFYRAPLAIVAFAAFLAGMLAMLAVSLRHDRRVREELRSRGLLEAVPAGPPAAVGGAWPVHRDPASPSRGEVGPDDDDRTIACPRDDERTAAYPRYDGDPAA